MKVFLTAISECDKKGFIEDTIRVAELNGQNIKYISMGDMLMDQLKNNSKIKINPKNILNLPEAERALHIEKIIYKIDKQISPEDNVIISGHAIFYWKKLFSTAFDFGYLNDVLKPDMYITLIDNSKYIKQNMDVSKQFSLQKMVADDISKWQNIEVITVGALAQIAHKEHYVLPRRESTGLLYKFMLRPDIPKIYASFPMSNIKTEKDKKEIDTFVDELNERGAVITPRSIELLKEFSEVEGSNTVFRDEGLFAGKTDMTVAYYMPKKKKLVFSAGVLAEIKKACESTKDVCAIVPNRYYGPFEKYYMENMFHSKEEFFNHMDSQGYTKHNIKM